MSHNHQQNTYMYKRKKIYKNTKAKYK